jgi:precorrin-8X/cobalt-precorrin-8 methylmutase
MTAAEIYAESFRIIEAEVGPHSYGPDEWPVVRRMIHATGDLEVARLVEFRNDAVRQGIAALGEGVPVVTDVRMVATGIDEKRLRALGIEVHSFIDDPDVAHLAQKEGLTRSHCAMVKATVRVPEAVYVVGNAPTALMALCAQVERKQAKPRLVLAMPVGFVAVVESKEKARSLAVPLIVVRGRKGGSAMAAAAVNALLDLALEGKQP